jgi:hypothetical protein
MRRQLQEGARSGSVSRCRPQEAEPPTTRSITNAFGLRYFLRAPSWPWWLTVSQTAPLPVQAKTVPERYGRWRNITTLAMGQRVITDYSTIALSSAWQEECVLKANHLNEFSVFHALTWINVDRARFSSLFMSHQKAHLPHRRGPQVSHLHRAYGTVITILPTCAFDSRYL